jgi:hypothetical protein
MSGYKIKKACTGRDSKYEYYSLNLPAELAIALRDKDMKFVPELTEEGILYRPISTEVIETPLPEWAQ